MKVVTDRRTKKYDLFKELNEKKALIKKEEVVLKKMAAKDRQITIAREFYAASKICALIRGYLDRLLCSRLRRRLRAIRTIQRIILGKLGRLRWKREYWRSVSVVKSDMALQEILARSSLLRTAEQEGNRGYHWSEYFDPLTESFWYFNKVTKQNTWQCPLVFQKMLVCHWEGFHQFGGLPHQRPCGCVFRNLEEYHGHMRTAHTWHCSACGERNPASCFPRCHLCDNKYSAEGVDGEKALQQQMEKVQRTLVDFLNKDVGEREAGMYSIRDRLVELAAERSTMQAQMLALSASGSSAAEQAALNRSYHSLARESYREREARLGKVAGRLSESLVSSSASGGDSVAGQMKLFQAVTKAAPLDSAVAQCAIQLPHVATLSDVNTTNAKFGGFIPSTVTPTPTIMDSRNDSVSSGDEQPVYRSVIAAAHAKEVRRTGGMEGEHERYRDPATRGVFSADQFQLLTSVHNEDMESGMHLDLFSDDEDDDESTVPPAASDEHTDVISIAGLKPEGSVVVSLTPGRRKIQVCARFLTGECSLSTCSLAHPGVRDSSQPKLKSSRGDNGEIVRTPFVTLCPLFDGVECSCPKGKACRKYHVYVRPSTKEIVRALYPIITGLRTRTLVGGAVISGNVAQDQFSGYAVMTWRDGSTYLGDWAGGRRDGFGIFRSGVDSMSGPGLEYVGCYKDGKRHGWGLLCNANGDEYLGEWRDGFMEGAGLLQSSNGDLYQGSFRRGKYEGVGLFRRGATGDVYMGQCRDGMAWGLGVLTMASGERYKGHFDRNQRHGKGACAYPNGTRYAGNWYRGSHQGFGVFLSADGDKYIGQWAGGKKHGPGRYMYANGDMYDGEFHKNRAHGLGVYYHHNGNIYTGQWVDDKRSGKGTYVFANGSKYTGHWAENNMHVKGCFDFANGSFYRGQFDTNTKHGRGIFTWPNGNVYKGEFHKEKMCGPGEMQYFTGHRYVGHWVDNKKNGLGTMYYSTGPIYVGDWVDDLRHGHGRITFMPGSAVEEAYEGQWVDDNWHGEGTYWYRKDEGTVYEGEWDMGVRHGFGRISYKDGSYYRGDFVRDQMWGKGVYVGADGSQYDGEWRANMRQGLGTSIGPDGCIHHGEYWGNMKHGKGKLLRPDGSTYTGTWEGGIVLGTGTVTFPVGDPAKKDGLPKQITMKVFGY